MKRIILLGFFILMFSSIIYFGQPKSEQNEKILPPQIEERTAEFDQYKVEEFKAEILEFANGVETKPINEESLVEEFKSIFDKITFSDKVTIGDILLTHFSFEELREYQQKVSDGITSEEKEELLNAFVSRVPKEDVQRLMDIANKYTTVLAVK